MKFVRLALFVRVNNGCTYSKWRLSTTFVSCGKSTLQQSFFSRKLNRSKVWGRSRIIVIVFLFNLSARWGCVVTLTPKSLHIYVKRLATHRIGGAKGLSGRVRKISPQQEFDHRILQPISSRCTYWPIPVHFSVRWTYLITNVKRNLHVCNRRYCHQHYYSCRQLALSTIVDSCLSAACESCLPHLCIGGKWM
jgi:hypothetical protein